MVIVVLALLLVSVRPTTPYRSGSVTRFVKGVQLLVLFALLGVVGGFVIVFPLALLVQRRRYQRAGWHRPDGAAGGSWTHSDTLEYFG